VGVKVAIVLDMGAGLQYEGATHVSQFEEMRSVVKSFLDTMNEKDGVELMGSPSQGYVGRITLVTGRTSEGNSYPVPENGIQLGRERGHVLFPEDGYVSGLHCSLTQFEGQMMLTDLESSNGSFIRLMGERELHEGDVLLMGQQLFRVAV
jgi:hypothetical protein